MASLTWLGHAAFRLDSDTGKRIYVDPWLTGNPKTPAEERSPTRVDVIAVTHGHGDHSGDAIAIAQAFPAAQIVCQVELKSWLGRKGAVPSGCISRSVATGQSCWRTRSTRR